MRVLKILGIVFGIFFLVTGVALAVGWQAAKVIKADTAAEWVNSQQYPPQR
ncbi:MAG TPA: hypothetical protein VHR39_01895 [Propionibacteriaceae bacterium]|nr:hypothetical protein [Propionibacteriaceae bacterium]